MSPSPEEKPSSTPERHDSLPDPKEKEAEVAASPPPVVKRRRGRPPKHPRKNKEDCLKNRATTRSEPGSSCHLEYGTIHTKKNQRAAKNITPTSRASRAARALQVQQGRKSNGNGKEKHPPPPTDHILPRGPFGNEPGYEGGSYVDRHSKRTLVARQEAAQDAVAEHEYDDSTDVDEDLLESNERAPNDHIAPCAALDEHRSRINVLLAPQMDVIDELENGLSSAFLSGQQEHPEQSDLGSFEGADDNLWEFSIFPNV